MHNQGSVDTLGWTIGLAYYIFLGFLGSYLAHGIANNRMPPYTTISVGLAFMLIGIALVIWTGYNMSGWFFGLVGLMFDFAGIAMGGSFGVSQAWSMVLACVIAALLLLLITIKCRSAVLRGKTPEAPIIP